MAELIAKSALAGQSPVTHGGVTLAETVPEPFVSVAPFDGMEDRLAGLLNDAGLGWPAPNRVIPGPGGRVVWSGRGQAFLFGPVPEGLDALAALSGQGDGWAGLSLTGDGAAEVLMRLVPLDLAAMGEGDAARSLLGHMSALFVRDTGGFGIWVFRSMARTAWHEIEAAMRQVAARGRI